ncbi:3329_t:CDS:2 [Ambispora gerdemannii]|uniref:3329_t:CDS:1 n=1 Tax=Ambispora gerdemannii TaxID=144530 RepID=A0A9N9DP06_9GLOM|nr:3329_t:CDS:2 [Ambispora gerdemannii]
MLRGYSLANDLKSLVNNQMFSDLTIQCGTKSYNHNNDSTIKDDDDDDNNDNSSNFSSSGISNTNNNNNANDSEPLYAQRAILGARSEYFYNLLYNGMKETSSNELKFPTITTSAMKITLEYIYTSENVQSTLESLKKSEIVDAFHAANYFLLGDLETRIVTVAEELIKNDDFDELVALLERAIDKLSLVDNNLYKLLCSYIGATPLNSANIEYSKFSSTSLQVLLAQTQKTLRYFATSEYRVFRYVVEWAANQISEDALETVKSHFQEAELSFYNTNQQWRARNSNMDDIQQQLLEILNPFLPFINLNLFDPMVIAKVIHPMRIIPDTVLADAYQYHLLALIPFNPTRGLSPLDNLRWDPSEFLIDSQTAEAPKDATCRAITSSNCFLDRGIYEWNIVVEKMVRGRIGIASMPSRNSTQSLGDSNSLPSWCVNSEGYKYPGKERYGKRLISGMVVTVHLDMNKRTVGFSYDESIEGIKNGETGENVEIEDNSGDEAKRSLINDEKHEINGGKKKVLVSTENDISTNAENDKNINNTADPTSTNSSQITTTFRENSQTSTPIELPQTPASPAFTSTSSFSEQELQIALIDDSYRQKRLQIIAWVRLLWPVPYFPSNSEIAAKLTLESFTKKPDTKPFMVAVLEQNCPSLIQTITTTDISRDSVTGHLIPKFSSFFYEPREFLLSQCPSFRNLPTINGDPLVKYDEKFIFNKLLPRLTREAIIVQEEPALFLTVKEAVLLLMTDFEIFQCRLCYRNRKMVDPEEKEDQRKLDVKEEEKVENSNEKEKNVGKVKENEVKLRNYEEVKSHLMGEMHKLQVLDDEEVVIRVDPETFVRSFFAKINEKAELETANVSDDDDETDFDDYFA